eukprot:CAMPEP_0202691922 /NCGR_PEP_ID=MMETSP1385-20130828/6477_1 /ASSEMBLY_ACC=CAM_ASM_000861 /TAXON_ID=933848 /ORGANISM="Elphidium margaritaceum" /LENGTH=410 /DNA_ID=CAMNT_0049347387 /DNA_START=42 /DNA_END=1277 /DNA_ORIENTATION=-
MNPALLAAIQKNGTRDPSKVDKSDRIKTKTIKQGPGKSTKFEPPPSASVGRVLSKSQATEKRANDPLANVSPPKQSPGPFDISAVKLKKVSNEQKNYNEERVATTQKVVSQPQSTKNNSKSKKQKQAAAKKANDKPQPSKKTTVATAAAKKKGASKKEVPKKKRSEKVAATPKSKPVPNKEPAKKVSKGAKAKKSAPAPAPVKKANAKPVPSSKQREKEYRQKDLATAKRRLSKRLSLTGATDSNSMIIKEVQKTGQLKSIGPVSDLIYGGHNNGDAEDQKSQEKKGKNASANTNAKAKKTAKNSQIDRKEKKDKKAVVPKNGKGARPKPKANASKSSAKKSLKPGGKKSNKSNKSKSKDAVRPGKIDHSKYANVEAISLDLNNTRRLKVNKKKDIEQQEHLKKIKRVHQ